MRRRWLGVAVLLAALASVRSAEAVPPDVLERAELAVERVNQYRELSGLPSVMLDDTLSEGALQHAKYLSLNVDQIAAGLAAHDEYPDRPGYSVEGEDAGKNSVIAFGDGGTESVDSWTWMIAVAHADDARTHERVSVIIRSIPGRLHLYRASACASSIRTRDCRRNGLGTCAPTPRLTLYRLYLSARSNSAGLGFQSANASDKRCRHLFLKQVLSAATVVGNAATQARAASKVADPPAQHTPLMLSVANGYSPLKKSQSCRDSPHRVPRRVEA